MPLFKVWSEDKLSKKFLYLKLLFLLVACITRQFKQSDSGDKAAKPRKRAAGSSWLSLVFAALQLSRRTQID